MSAPRTGRHQATVESAPLLGNGGYLPGGGVVQDHPAFLRASHSPWSCLPQNVLVVVRGFIVVYLIATAAMVLDYELTQDKTVTKKSGLWFNFALISGLLVLIYHLIAFSWTYTHLYYPDPLLCETTFEAWIIRIMSLPHDLGNLRKQFRFTLFYTVVVVFAFMNTTIYWFVTRPHNGKMPSDGNGGNGGSGGGGGTGGGNSTLPYSFDSKGPFSDLFGEGWFKAFVIFNLYFIASIIMIIEMLFLNSIKRPFAIGCHLFGIVFFATLYIVWAVIGIALTKSYPFFWLHKKEVGSQEAVVYYSIGFVLLAPIEWVFMQGFVGIRESMTRTTVIIQTPLGN